ncbi:hypothetical protein M7I_6152 [Glarea lozoyensis 74030]|uniref:Uncharacterized protein n=1 Tax=Glarea lozoyensis (strain ATCC 74030 / MF5533) TaxID=1104152 RepID=H0ETT3_GLAL7|nr:hypothetical protein M7I_6152 [Glarea lozoyensis 74030]
MATIFFVLSGFLEILRPYIYYLDLPHNELSIPSRAKLPVFLVGEHTASLFPPFEFDLAQQDNREENINRSRSRTGSLTSHIYDDLPLSPICGTVPNTFVYDDHPLVSPRPPLGSSMKTWPQMNRGDNNEPSHLTK